MPTPGQDGQTQQTETAEAEVEAEPVLSILPDASTDQLRSFRFAPPVQNDLETAEQAFIEFSGFVSRPCAFL